MVMRKAKSPTYVLYTTDTMALAWHQGFGWGMVAVVALEVVICTGLWLVTLWRT